MSVMRRAALVVATMAAGLAAAGMGFAPTYAQQNDIATLESRRSSQSRRVAVKRMRAAHSGHPLPIRKKRDATPPAKHTSRAKARKRTRCKAKRRAHR